MTTTFSSIIGLFSFGCPPAVLRRVVAIIVDPVDRVGGRWTGAHIDKKRTKIVFPAVTHSDTPPTVRRVFDVLRVVTPTFKAGPTIVLRGSNASVGKHTALLPSVLTSAGLRQPFTKCVRANSFYPPAFTLADPVSLSASNRFINWLSVKYSKPTKGVSGEVDTSRFHPWSIAHIHRVRT